MKCSICDREVNDDVKTCPNCGHNFDFKYVEDGLRFRTNFCDYEPAVHFGRRHRRHYRRFNCSLFGNDRAQEAYNELHGIKSEPKELSDIQKAFITFGILIILAITIPLIILII